MISRDTESTATVVVDYQTDENGHRRPVTLRVRLIGRKLLLRGCTLGERGPDGDYRVGPIVIPDAVKDRNWWYRIVAVSPDCRYYGPEHVGAFVKLSDTGAIGNSWRVGPYDVIANEDWLLNVNSHGGFVVSKETDE